MSYSCETEPSSTRAVAGRCVLRSERAITFQQLPQVAGSPHLNSWQVQGNCVSRQNRMVHYSQSVSQVGSIRWLLLHRLKDKHPCFGWLRVKMKPYITILHLWTWPLWALNVLNLSFNAGIQNICEYFIRLNGKVGNHLLGKDISGKMSACPTKILSIRVCLCFTH